MSSVRALGRALAVLVLLAGAVPARLGSAAADPGILRPSAEALVPVGGLSGAAAPTYSLARARLADGRTVVLRWNPCQVITYVINVAAVPTSQRAAVATELRSAVTRLGAATGIGFSYRGTTTWVPRSTTISGQSAELVIAVTTPRATDYRIGDGVLGYGGYRYWQWTTVTSSGRRSSAAAIARGWVVLDAAGLVPLKPGFGPGTTRGNVMLHELAHTQGLGHVADRRQLMYQTLHPTSPNGYAAGDRAGLAAVGRGAGCLLVPSNVVADLR